MLLLSVIDQIRHTKSKLCKYGAQEAIASRLSQVRYEETNKNILSPLTSSLTAHIWLASKRDLWGEITTWRNSLAPWLLQNHPRHSEKKASGVEDVFRQLRGVSPRFSDVWRTKYSVLQRREHMHTHKTSWVCVYIDKSEDSLRNIILACLVFKRTFTIQWINSSSSSAGSLRLLGWLGSEQWRIVSFYFWSIWCPDWLQIYFLWS